MYKIDEIAKKFQIPGTYISAQPYGSGHINDTFLVKFEQDDSQTSYIFQRINHNIFKNPLKLVENISLVTNHIRKKLIAKNTQDIDRKVLTLIKTVDGKDCLIHEDNYWRVYIFITDAQTYDVLENLDQAENAASAFGEFQKDLADLDKSCLFETIPDFHNGPKRFEAFQEALKADKFDRASSAKAEIDFLTDNRWIFDVLPDLVAKGQIPVRITHNDTKINNVMLDDKTGKGICVIDLDTVMPGLTLYDFGDMVRTSTSSAAEDEKDLSKVFMHLDRFEAVVKGYLSTACSFLNQAEKDNLVLSGKMITLMIGTRFLTDYLSGDTYFKVHRDGHNLDRCRTQFKLVQSITEQESQMQELVKKYSGTN